MSDFIIKDFGTDDTGWYISDGCGNYVWKDLTTHSNTGFPESSRKYGESPGYYHSAEEAKQYLDAYLYIENLKRSVLISNCNSCCGWYVQVNGEYLWKDFTLNSNTGHEFYHEYGTAPGYYRSEHEAKTIFRLYVESEKQKQLNKIRGTKMKVGDTVKITDGSYALKVCNGELRRHSGNQFKEELWKILAFKCDIPSEESYRGIEHLNTIVEGVDSDIVAFVLEELCTVIPTEQNVEIRYFCDDRDVTTELSEQSKRNLRNL